jgi:DHA1 family inner membrane transport protein
MDPASSSHFSIRQTVVALIIGSVALLMLGIQPILLGELQKNRLITMEGVGIVAMGEIFALGLGVALGNALLPVSRHKLITVLATLLTAGLDVATGFASGDGGFTAVRAASGLAEGVLVWSTVSIIVRSANPERLAAVFMVAQTVAQVVIATLLASFVVPQSGWEGGFKVLAVLAASCAVLAAWLPPKLEPLQTSAVEKLRWTVSRLLPLVIAFLMMAAIGSLFTYLEPLGEATGLDDDGAGFTTSLVLAMQVAGGIAATWSVGRFGVVLTLCLGSAVLAAVAGGIHFLPGGAVSPFKSLFAVFGFAWLFLMPFHVALAFRADPKGRVAVLIPAAQLVGSATGPLIASLTMTGDDARTVPLVSLGFALSAAFLVAAGRRLWVNSQAVEVNVLPALEPRDDPEPAY